MGTKSMNNTLRKSECVKASDTAVSAWKMKKSKRNEISSKEKVALKK